MIDLKRKSCFRNLKEEELKEKYNFHHSYDRACIMEAVRQAKRDEGDETDVSISTK